MWIWLTGNIATNREEGDEILQIEWAKSRARAARAAEEVLLLREEMRRVIEFLKWKSKWWVSRVEYQSEDGDMAEGLCAYAHKQASLQNSLSQHFQSAWKTLLEELSIDDSQPTVRSDGIDDDSDREENPVSREHNTDLDDNIFM